MPKTVIITGANGALGQSVTDVFKEEGWNLSLWVHSGADALRESRPEAHVHQADLGLEDEAMKAAKATLDRFSHIDALLNIAGGFAMSEATETSTDDLRKQLTLNLWTAFNATRAVLPGMLEQGRGLIVGVGAKPAVAGAAKMGPYAASKAAMISYLHSVRAELEAQGIKVAVVYPMGTIDTPANREAMPDSDPDDWIDPKELARSMLFLSERSRRGHLHELKVYPASA